MHKGIFSRLAKQNIRNNKSTYIPYIITCIFCIAMIYMMEFLRDCPTLDQAVRQADEVRMIVFTGEIVVEIFCIIFLIYSNSFLMKRRQKEIGLYNILGLERNHIGIVMFLETIITSIGSLAGGIAAGIIGSKLALLLLLKLLHIPSVLGFYISVKGIFTCLFMFGIIFLMILFLNLAKIHLSRPVELLRGNNTGEKEPVAKWLMALIGFICLGAGYYLAVTTESPIKAITIFLLAVILVMAGTYLLFTAGSIVILKFLRRRKSFYYRTGNFISISGMLYRMKQNAIGLASICILSTGVLLMISMTVSIYFGMNDIMLNRYPYDVDMSVTSISEDECQTAIEAFEKAIADNKVPVEKSVEEIYLDIVCSKNGDQILIKPANTIRNSDSVLVLSLLNQAEYERLTGISANLNDGEIFAWYPLAVQKDSVTVDETEFTVKKWLDKNPLTCGEDAVSDNAVLVVTDEDFKKFVLGLTGIDLNAYKEKQMKRRIDTLIARNKHTGYDSYCNAIKNDAQMLDEFVNYLTINVSEFYRNPALWKKLDEIILPDLIKKFGPRLKIWSAACSTGDEPYSLAMVLAKKVPLKDIKIYATDIDDQVLEKAKDGVYSANSLKGLPDEYKNKYFEKMGDKYYKISDEIKKCVEFKKSNLLKDSYPQSCHLIVCRNVLIYFTEDAKLEIYKKFNDSLVKGGCLFVGNTEQIINYKDLGYESSELFFYRKK